MNISITYFIHWIIMSLFSLTGVILFSIKSFNQEFLWALVLLMLSLLFVNIYGIITRSLSNKALIYLLSISLLFIAVSVFGNYGFEQIAIGHETLYDFSLKGIAIAILLFFISSFLFVVGTNNNLTITQTRCAQEERKRTINVPQLIPKQATNETVIDSDDWEEASAEDIESGQYVI